MNQPERTNSCKLGPWCATALIPHWAWHERHGTNDLRNNGLLSFWMKPDAAEAGSRSRCRRKATGGPS